MDKALNRDFSDSQLQINSDVALFIISLNIAVYALMRDRVFILSLVDFHNDSRAVYGVEWIVEFEAVLGSAGNKTCRVILRTEP